MKHLFFGSVALLALAAAGPVVAADMPVRAPVYKAPPAMVAAHNWTGFYIGGHLGGGWATKDWISVGDPASGGGPLGFVDASYSASAFLGGVQAGFNYQTGWVVWGVEADASWTNLKGSASCFGPQTCRSKTDWMVTLTPRVGAAFDRALLYVKGGVAWVHDNFENQSGSGAIIWAADARRTGWTVGGGAEYAIDRNWSAKIEYNYLDFGTWGNHFIDPSNVGSPFNEDIQQKIHVVKAGINYRFGDFGKGPVVVTRY